MEVKIINGDMKKALGETRYWNEPNGVENLSETKHQQRVVDGFCPLGWMCCVALKLTLKQKYYIS